MLMGLQKKKDPCNRSKGHQNEHLSKKSPELITSDFINSSTPKCLIIIITLYNSREYIYLYTAMRSLVQKSALAP